MAGLIIKPRSRIFHGHDWVYSSEIKKTFGNPEPGQVVSLKDYKDRSLGSAIYNPQSQIVARRFSRRKQKLDVDFFYKRIKRSIICRELDPSIDVTLSRLVWSESDGLPGLIIDRYEDHIVIQTLTLGMDLRINEITEAIKKLSSPKSIITRNDSPIRAAEGLKMETNIIEGCPPKVIQLEHFNIPFSINLLSGQKTGLYLDQLHNYKLVGELASNKRVLDCFTNQGGFAISCLLNGAIEATGIDISETAIKSSEANSSKINNNNSKWIKGNVFDLLKSFDSENHKYDMIILDPPSFTKNKKSISDAMRGYKEIHLRSLKLLEPGGILTTFSCSHHVASKIFLDMIRDASNDAKKSLRIIDQYRQRSDHPISLGIPESSYLKGYSFEVVASW